MTVDIGPVRDLCPLSNVILFDLLSEVAQQTMVGLQQMPRFIHIDEKILGLNR